MVELLFRKDGRLPKGKAAKIPQHSLKFNIVARIHGNCLYNLRRLVTSVLVQNHKNFTLHLAVDQGGDKDSSQEIEKECLEICDNPFSIAPSWLTRGNSSSCVKYWPNPNGRLYSVLNTCRVLDALEEDSIVGLIDADDQLCERRCLEWIETLYSQGVGCVWTNNIWEPYSINLCSAPLDDSANVYQHPWVSSHFRTFLLSTYKKINKENFKDENGEWMKRCEDQTLMLPIINKLHSEGKRTQHLNKPCYLYRGYQEIGGEAHQYQLQMERFIRQRGYIK